MDNGWITLHRKTLDNPIVMKDPDYFSVWVYLLLNATHKEYDVIFKGKRIKLKQGELITGRKSICNSFKNKVSESKVQRILKTFESEQQIEQQTSSEKRLIKVNNWIQYQQSEQQSEQQVNNNRTTSEQQVNTNNNVNNVNNDNNVNNKTKLIEKDFNIFYQAYPIKKSKKAAKKAFEKVNVDITVLLSAIKQQADEKELLRRNGEFCPEWKHPSTWLNQGCWEDETREITPFEEAKALGQIKWRTKHNASAEDWVRICNGTLPKFLK